MRIGIDTGGTFSDFVMLDERTGALRTAKVPSTPHEPAQAIRAGLALLGSCEYVDQVVVGTTVATNAVIERKGPKMVFVTNQGFTDLPFIARTDKERLYDLHWDKPKPLVARRDCIGVDGRIGHLGEQIEGVSRGSLLALADRLLQYDDEEIAVAVCLLFSYLAPEHEACVADAVRDVLPEAAISVSHQVSPVWREYERATTTIADAFVKPVVDGYIDAVGGVLQTELGAERWSLLASNGGHLGVEEARARPARLLLSGLAGGVVAAAFWAHEVGMGSVFSLDMGGTSSDIGLVLDGEQQYATEFDLAWGMPVSMPCVAVQTIGAGGGSVAWMDRGGLLHVGPQSAGADPGPAAYAKGGTEPTLTDANLVLGRLDPHYFLGGVMVLAADAAREAFGVLGARLAMQPEEAALAAVRTADENMSNAIRLIAVERGLDPRDFALIAFGGAGPLHARAVAERLDIRTVLIPPRPGLCSAFGACITQARVDRVRTYFARSDRIALPDLAAVERALRAEAVRELRQMAPDGELALERVAAMRYAGQNFELEVAIPQGDLDEGTWAALLKRFADDHERQYGFALANEVVELINLRITAVRPEPIDQIVAPTASGSSDAGMRGVWFDPSGPTDCLVYRRESLPEGSEIEGPAIIEEPDSTTLLLVGDVARLEPSGVLVVTIGDVA